MYENSEVSKSLPEPSCRKYQVNFVMEDDYSVPTTSHYYQRQNTEGVDAFGFEDCTTSRNYENYGPYVGIHTKTTHEHTESEGNLSTRTSKKNSPYTGKVLKITSSCNLSQEIETTDYDAAAVRKKTALKKPPEQDMTAYKKDIKTFIRNENRVMFLEQQTYDGCNYDQFSSQGSSNAPAESVRCRSRSEVSRNEKTTNCRPVPNVHCKEVTNITVERNARLQRLVKKIAKMRQKERQVQQWNTYIESLKNKHKSETEVEHMTNEDYFNKKFTDEMSATDGVGKEEPLRVSVRRSEATSVTTTPPFDPDALDGQNNHNIQSLAMPCGFGGFGFYPNQQPCFYQTAYPAMGTYPHFLQYPSSPQSSQSPQSVQLQYFQYPCQELQQDANTDNLQDGNSYQTKTKYFSSFSNKNYHLMNSSTQTNKDFGIQVFETREIQTNTDETIPIDAAAFKSDPIMSELHHMSKNIEKLKKKSHGAKSQEITFTKIEEKLDTLLQSINTFIAKVNTQTPAHPSPTQDESPPTCSSSSFHTGIPVGDNRALMSSQNTPAPSALVSDRRVHTCSRARPPQTGLANGKSSGFCSRPFPPRNLHNMRRNDNITGNNNQIVATRSEPYRVPQPDDIACNVVVSTGDSFNVNERKKEPSSSRSKLDIIRTLLEEIENNRVTRDTDSAMSKGNCKRNSCGILKKECCTITDSLSMTPLIEQKMEEVYLGNSIEDIPERRAGSSKSRARIMSIAVNTEPLSMYSLFRVSKDAMKQILSYMPQIDSLLPRYLGCSSFFWQPSESGTPHFSCNICGAAFMKPSQLSDHIASHGLGAVK